MTAAWVLYVLAVGALLAMGASAGASALRALGRSTRGIHAAALAGLLTLALIAPRQRTLDVGRVSRVAVVNASGDATPRSLTLRDRAQAIRTAIDDAASDVAAVLHQRVTPATTRFVVAGWAGTSGVLLALFVFLNWRIARTRRAIPV